VTDYWTVSTVEANGLEFTVATQRPVPAPSPAPTLNTDTDTDTVLLLHGFPQTHRAFDALATRLIPHGLRLIAPDQRGYSPGARPDDVAAYAMPELVADALAILDAFGVAQAHVVGHDWGAAVAWNLAARHPERVRTLTAASIPHPSALAEATVHSADQRERSVYIELFREEGKGENLLLDDGQQRLRRLFTPLPDHSIEPHLAVLGERKALTGALNWYRAMKPEESLALPPATVPVTYVWSDADVAVSREAAERCAAHVTGPYRFVELPGVSHWVPDEAPDQLAAAVLDRIGAHPADPPAQ
jgi:pimeloyl-ACP methyl ester carboxylesterase